MSRRHNSSRRRSYGRRQHEVRERRGGFAAGREWQTQTGMDDWRATDGEEDRSTPGAPDSFGGASL